MKIIEGPSWPKRIICQVCHAALEIDETDLETKDITTITPTSVGLYTVPIKYIACPICKNWIVLS